MTLPPKWPAALMALGCAWNTAVAQQKTTVEVGVLTCSIFESGPAETGAGVEVQERDILCSFRLRSGAEETYTGKLRGVGVSGEYKGTLLWLVKAPPTVMPSPPGLLQQSYTADAKAPADVIPALIGEVNSDIVLQSMADKDEARTGAPEKSKPGDFAVLGVGLKLRSASG
jgi:hypothetical protein